MVPRIVQFLRPVQGRCPIRVTDLKDPVTDFLVITENRYLKLPSQFYELVSASPVPHPQTLLWNEELAKRLELTFSFAEIAQHFSGQQPFPQSRPFAMAYAGHQFGGFVPQLGDGRALMIGEARSHDGSVFDLHLKGSGRTRFSRGGDGKCPLGPALREYMISHWMTSLGVPSTESLAVVLTGESVDREEVQPGAVLTRVARSHLRVGTFEYFGAREDSKNLKLLLDFAILDLYPEIKSGDFEKDIFHFFETVMRRQIQTVSLWMKFGFIHGVMNTDNTTISGQTIDFGPCAFLDQYDPQKKFSSIDVRGRYRYANQGNILLWNLSALASALLVLWPEDERPQNVDAFRSLLESGQKEFEQSVDAQFAKKIGLKESTKESKDLVTRFLSILHVQSLDFTKSFRSLHDFLVAPPAGERSGDRSAELLQWTQDWKVYLESTQQPQSETLKMLSENNPVYIPRNHLVEQAIRNAVERKDLSLFNELYEVGRRPFEWQNVESSFEKGPDAPDPAYKTYCGT